MNSVESPAENPPAPSTNEMALVRTVMALDRTLLAWIRTSLTLIGFGFTLARFVHDMMKQGPFAGVHGAYPREIGVGLMAMGVVTLIGGAWEYVAVRKRLHLEKACSSCPVSLIIAILLAVLGGGLVAGLMLEMNT